MPIAYLPSPARSAWHLGPVALHAQALCVVAGIVLALWVADRRYRRAGGPRGVILDVAAWAVPAGLMPAVIAILLDRVQSGVLQDLRTWDEAAGFPAAVAFGLVGAWFGRQRMRSWHTAGSAVPARSTPVARARGRGARIRLAPVAGAAAPALLFGHALAMAGNWFAQRDYGKPSSLWWAVSISPARRALGLENYATFQPLFAYQALCDVAAGIAIIYVAHRFTLAGGQVLALAAAAYAVAGFPLFWLGIGHSPAVLGLPATTLGDAVLLVASGAGLVRMTRGRVTSSQLANKAPLERSRPLM